jgi:hypothetical protein
LTASPTVVQTSFSLHIRYLNWIFSSSCHDPLQTCIVFRKKLLIQAQLICLYQMKKSMHSNIGWTNMRESTIHCAGFLDALALIWRNKSTSTLKAIWNDYLQQNFYISMTYLCTTTMLPVLVEFMFTVHHVYFLLISWCNWRIMYIKHYIYWVIVSKVKILCSTIIRTGYCTRNTSTCNEVVLFSLRSYIMFICNG